MEEEIYLSAEGITIDGIMYPLPKVVVEKFLLMNSTIEVLYDEMEQMRAEAIDAMYPHIN